MPNALKLPEFVIAGATRSGTTTLFEALSKNSGVFMPTQKELHFYCRDKDYAQGAGFYARYFDGAAPDQICGEASPAYLTHAYTQDENGRYAWSEASDSAARMAKTVPDIKIILSLRHPATRAHSYYQRTRWQGREAVAQFEDVVEEELSGVRKPQETELCPLYINRYKTHLAHWLAHFPRDQILIVIMEEWSAAPAETLAQIEDFIGAPRSGLSDEQIKPVNQGRKILHPALAKIAPRSRAMRFLKRFFLTQQGSDALSPETRVRLDEVFADDIAVVEEIIGREVPAWK